MIWLHDYCSIVSVFFLIIGGIGLQLNEMLEEKLRPYVEEIDNGELSRPIIIQQAKDQKVSIYLFPDPEIWIMLLYIGCKCIKQMIRNNICRGKPNPGREDGGSSEAVARQITTSLPARRL